MRQQHRFSLLCGSILDFDDDNGEKVVDKTVTVCKHCATPVTHASGNTSNMLSHLRGHYPSVSTDSTRRRESGGEEQLPNPAVLQQPLSEKSDRVKAITKALGEFIVKDMQPYAMLVDVGFQHLVKVLKLLYNIPSCRRFSNTVIPELYEETRRRIVKELSNRAYVALATDERTFRATESFFTGTAHHITAEYEVKNYILQTQTLYESHTSEHLSDARIQAVLCVSTSFFQFLHGYMSCP